MCLWAITFDWTVSFGTVLMTVTLMLTILTATWTLIYSVKSRLEVFQTTLVEHAEALHKHDKVLGLYETRIFELVGGLQRLIGRFEAEDRRTSPRRGPIGT